MCRRTVHPDLSCSCLYAVAAIAVGWNDGSPRHRCSGTQAARVFRARVSSAERLDHNRGVGPGNSYGFWSPDAHAIRSGGWICLVKLALSPQTAEKEQRRAQDLPRINPKAEDER